jgi:Hint module
MKHFYTVSYGVVVIVASQYGVVFDVTWAEVVPLSLDNTAILDVEGDPNANMGWIDSYSVGDYCYCSSTFDHDIGTKIVSTPLGRKTVRQVCDMINVNAPSKQNRPVYNDIQCGNGPDNDLRDEMICPGRVDHGKEGCQYIGPKWNFKDVVPTDETILCFSFTNTVEIKDYGFVPIHQLQIGDWVRVGHGFSQVYGFGHFEHNRAADFLRIQWNESSSLPYHDDNHHRALEISPNHLVFIENNTTTTTTSRNSKVIPASALTVGDIISGKVIISIDRVTRRGFCAPLTHSGDIVVSGIRSSNYIIMMEHDWIWNHQQVGHAYLFPHRLYCQLFWNTCQTESYSNNGYSFWVYILVRLCSLVKDNNGPVVTFVVGLFSTIFVSTVYVIESTMLLLFLLFGLYVVVTLRK